MGKKQRIAVIGVVIGLTVALLAVFTFIMRNDAPNDKNSAHAPSTARYTHEETGLSFEYPASKLELAEITQQDQKDRIFFRGQQKTVDATPFLVTVRYETNLRQAAAMSKMSTIDVVHGGAERSLPARFPDYKELENSNFEQGRHDAAKIVYTYKGPSGDVIQQVLYMIAKDDNTVVYITVQAKEVDFAALEKDIFDTLFKSTEFK